MAFSGLLSKDFCIVGSISSLNSEWDMYRSRGVQLSYKENPVRHSALQGTAQAEDGPEPLNTKWDWACMARRATLYAPAGTSAASPCSSGHSSYRNPAEHSASTHTRVWLEPDLLKGLAPGRGGFSHSNTSRSKPMSRGAVSSRGPW